MKYFTKYLPVEGEIKPDDLYFQTYKEGQVGKANKDDYSNGAYKDKQKVKLFLCSRDIAVGDTVVWLHKYTWSMFQEFPVTTQEGVDIMKKDHAGKWGVKIGEISPEATWVKEDMEFNEEDIHKACYHPEHRVVDQWDISDEEWADWKPNNGYLKCWMIKCSQCGHYH